MVAWRHGSSLRRWFFAAFGIGIISLLAFSYYLSNFNTLIQSAKSLALSAATKFTPVLKESKFLEEGVMTPEEFVTAGDHLVHLYPYWSWESAVYPENYLPKNRQVLCCKGLPTRKESERPIHVVEEDGMTIITEEEEEEEDAETYLEQLENLGEETYLEQLEEMLESNVVRTRTYDLYITYDKYYQVGRLWFRGWDENHQALSFDQMLADVSDKHARKTVTLEKCKELGIHMPTVHPCRQTNVIKQTIDENKKSLKIFRVEETFPFLLKLFHNAIPNINYDFTR
ncbi:ATG3 [Cordylochernes scorpioides]|uniref:Ubiquitin-like-conjugating enzyme ATG3 n=1 Tax=Cordylochernes scorpioides TaxID=51811 RepID=A0ABY6L4N9_9ARAC|nr:ATG3 [Cordylochernes scorpioides]